MTPHPTAPTRPAQNSPTPALSSAASTTPCVALIAAVAANGIIGAAGRLPWRLADDMKRFRALTLGHCVVMGRKTWESLSGPLAERQNIVVTRQGDYAAAGAEIAGSFAEALALARLPRPIFCIGGEELYRVALPYASRVYLTELADAFDGDARFPALAAGAWVETARETRTADAATGLAYAYVTYERAGPAPSRAAFP